jgi:hypothetical protein
MGMFYLIHLINKMCAFEAVCLVPWDPFVSRKHNLLCAAVVIWVLSQNVVTRQSRLVSFLFRLFSCVVVSFTCIKTSVLGHAASILKANHYTSAIQERGTLSKVVRKCEIDLRRRFETLKDEPASSIFQGRRVLSFTQNIAPSTTFPCIGGTCVY